MIILGFKSRRDNNELTYIEPVYVEDELEDFLSPEILLAIYSFLYDYEKKQSEFLADSTVDLSANDDDDAFYDQFDPMMFCLEEENLNFLYNVIQESILAVSCSCLLYL